MTVNPGVDTTAEAQLAPASPDLLRHLLGTFIQTLPSAEADACCGRRGVRGDQLGAGDRRNRGTAQSDRVVDSLTDKLPRSPSIWRLPAPSPGQGFFKPRPRG